MTKINSTKKKMQNYSKKPISINSTENIFSNYSQNLINIIKLNNDKKYM